MLHLTRIRLLAPLAFLVVGTAACTTTTVTETATPPPGTTPDETPAEETTPTPTPDPAKPKGIGEWTEKGLAFVDVSPATPTSCSAFCASKGGSCLPAIAVENGAAGGKAMYYSSTSSLQVPRALDCDDVATETYLADVYYPHTPTLGSLTCSCDDVPVLPRVIVPPTESQTCKAVCESWKKACDDQRPWEIGFDPSGGLAFYASGDVAELSCTSAPTPKKDGSALESYICACK